MKKSHACALSLFLLSAALIAAPALGAETPPARPASSPTVIDEKAADAGIGGEHLLPAVAIEDARLDDMIDFFRDVTGSSLFVDWKRLEAANIDRATRINLKFAEPLKVSKALQAVLDAAAGKGRLACRLGDGAWIISTTEWAELVSHAYKGLDPRRWNDEIRGQFARRVPTALFRDITLSRALEILSDKAGCKFDIDWAGFEKVGVKRDAVVKVSSIKSDELRCDQAILLIFASVLEKPVEVTPREGRIHIVPVKVQSKTYDIRDLLKHTPGGAARDELAKQLVRLITDLVDENSWDKNGKTCRIDVARGELIVNQTVEHHADIENLLRQIRQPPLTAEESAKIEKLLRQPREAPASATPDKLPSTKTSGK